MFKRILHANDGSDRAFEALRLAARIAKQNKAQLHMVCVEEIDYMPELIEEVGQEIRTAARRFHAVVERARGAVAEQRIALKTHILAGHPVRDILRLSDELSADLIIIGGTGHSSFYERMLGTTAARIVHLAKCPVLVVK
jgi:nucleotide-binding universal stress UspA family protein